jgi:dienelactone hydrolase
MGRALIRCCVLLLVLSSPFALGADDPTRVWDKPVTDVRTELIRSLHEGSGFKPYGDKAAWTARATYLRQQVLIAAGLWPMPEKTPLDPVIFGRVERDGYSVEKVYFQSYPGFFVTGNLYRPSGRAGPFPAVLCPHGHWNNGRLYEASDKEVAAQIKGGWEKDADAAKYPLQARSANLAKLGCVVFFYDMVGYADSDPKHFPHRSTYVDADSDLHGLSVFGLQTWDSIRAVDFILSLPEIDPARVACTGASGGGTQTFMLMNADPRLSVAAPVCMISAGEHQGGCVCENNSLLRIGTDNVELAATFAPKPLIHPTATGDWTKEFLEHGFPELKATYRLFDAEPYVESFRQDAGHNYNLKSREGVYQFFNQHLKLGHSGAVTEQKFQPLTPKELTVFDEEHPRPSEAVDAPTLKRYLIDGAARQMEALKPKDAASLERFRGVMGPAVEHMLATRMPAGGDGVIGETIGSGSYNGGSITKLTLRRTEDRQAIPAILFESRKAAAPITVLILPEGKKGALTDNAAPSEITAGLLGAGHAVLVPDVCGIGELAASNQSSKKAVEFVYGYNRTTMANRVHDILTAVGWATKPSGARGRVNLVGVGKAGPWCLLARGLAGDAVHAAVIDCDGFDFTAVQSTSDTNYLPHSLRYGGIWPMAALGAPGRLVLYGMSSNPTPGWLRAAYDAAGATDQLRVEAETPRDLAKLLQ